MISGANRQKKLSQAFRLGLLAGALLIPQSCGSEPSEEEIAQERAQQEAEFHQKYAASICAAREPCCQANGQKLIPDCSSALVATLQYNSIFAAKYGNSPFDKARADVCLATVADLTAKQNICSDEGSRQIFPTTGGVCDTDSIYPAPPAPPLLNPGDPCTDDEQCPGSADGGMGACLVTDTLLTARLCRIVYTSKTAGEGPCSGIIEADGTFLHLYTSSPVSFACDRASGLTCDVTDSEKCVPQLTVGADCTGKGSCAYNLTCDKTSGTCVALQPIGGSCTKGDDCQDSNTCKNGVCTRLLGFPCASE